MATQVRRSSRDTLRTTPGRLQTEAEAQDQTQTQAQPEAHLQAHSGTAEELAVKHATLIAKVEDGMSIRQAATETGLSRMTALRLVRAWDSTDYAGVVRNLLVSKGIAAVEDWAHASRQASDKGRHEPARDLLTHAGIIDPVTGQSGTGQTNIAIVIGTPDNPVSLGPRK